MQESYACAPRARLLFVAFVAGLLAACETMPSAIEPIMAPDAKGSETTGREVRLDDAGERAVSLA